MHYLSLFSVIYIMKIASSACHVHKLTDISLGVLFESKSDSAYEYTIFMHTLSNSSFCATQYGNSAFVTRPLPFNLLNVHDLF